MHSFTRNTNSSRQTITQIFLSLIAGIQFAIWFRFGGHRTWIHSIPFENAALKQRRCQHVFFGRRNSIDSSLFLNVFFLITVKCLFNWNFISKQSVKEEFRFFWVAFVAILLNQLLLVCVCFFSVVFIVLFLFPVIFSLCLFFVFFRSCSSFYEFSVLDLDDTVGIVTNGCSPNITPKLINGTAWVRMCLWIETENCYRRNATTSTVTNTTTTTTTINYLQLMAVLIPHLLLNIFFTINILYKCWQWAKREGLRQAKRIHEKSDKVPQTTHIHTFIYIEDEIITNGHLTGKTSGTTTLSMNHV